MVPVNQAPGVFKKDDVVVLLGAGASVNAGIPHSATMVRSIEDNVGKVETWKEFGDLYYYVRSAIFYAEGIRGRIDAGVAYNIERLVESLDELRRRDQHPLYPFVGAWNPRLQQVAGEGLEKVDRFRDKIVEILRHDWIEIQNYDAAKYFEGLLRFQQEINHPLRVFTLNYDLCVERICQSVTGALPERGFDEKRAWKWQLFEDAEGRARRILLYKLHGSVDWQYDSEHGAITFTDSPAKIKPSETALIFGTSYKLQYVDPFLFLVYEFRRWTLDAKLLLLIGYGFGDEHVNGILRQAVRGDGRKKLVTVGPIDKRSDATPEEKALAELERRKWIASRLQLDEKEAACIKVFDMPAKQFLENDLKLASMASLFPDEDALFQDLAPK